MKRMVDVRTLWPADVDDDSRTAVAILDPAAVTCLRLVFFDEAVQRFMFELSVRDAGAFSLYAAKGEAQGDAVARIMGALGLEVSR